MATGRSRCRSLHSAIAASGFAATFAGVRYSVDCGSLADPDSDAFDYAEGNAPHAQGFAVLTYKGGKLLPPELVEIVNGEAVFRGEVVC